MEVFLMPLVTTKEMFKKAYEGHYAIGAFNVNNMEIVQGITEAAKELNAPLILQCPLVLENMLNINTLYILYRLLLKTLVFQSLYTSTMVQISKLANLVLMAVSLPLCSTVPTTASKKILKNKRSC